MSTVFAIFLAQFVANANAVTELSDQRSFIQCSPCIQHVWLCFFRSFWLILYFLKRNEYNLGYCGSLPEHRMYAK